MIDLLNISSSDMNFHDGLERVEMLKSPGGLHFVREFQTEKSRTELTPSVCFELEKAAVYEATAVYFRHFYDTGRPSVPQIYVYDLTGSPYDQEQMAVIHKNIWSGGVVPLVYVFCGTELKIFDCTKPAVSDDAGKAMPNYLEEHISILGTIDLKLKKYRATLFDSGSFWEQDSFKESFSFSNSAYNRLLGSLKDLYKRLVKSSALGSELVQRIIVQSILIKYLEERKDDEGNTVFPSSFFNQFNGDNFSDVIRNGSYLYLLDDLNQNRFNGKIFEWSKSEERKLLKQIDLGVLADFLDATQDRSGAKDLFGFRYYSFNHLPVELISRLYEYFLHLEENTENGLVYTPPHLARLLVDECMPIDYPVDDVQSYKILDPSCGSGIFLVTAFKRLVQWWRLKNNYASPPLGVLKLILSKCINGVDKKPEAVRLTRFSLSLALCDMLTPREIWQNLIFESEQDGRLKEGDFFDVRDSLFFDEFNLVIGNPPFIRGAVKEDIKWVIDDINTIAYPQGDIAYRFLTDSMLLLKDKGTQCLIMPSSFLYNHTVQRFREGFFNQHHVVQVFDFSALSRNQVLWDNSEPATVAVFSKKQKPDYKINVLHLTLRRTKTTKERILFEVDDYDFHYISRYECSEHWIWKVNLFGGGRLISILKRFKHYSTLKNFIDKNKNSFWKANEGLIVGKADRPNYKPGLEKWDYLPARALDQNGIDLSQVTLLRENKFDTFPGEEVFMPPSILINETLKDGQLAVGFNPNRKLTFKANIISIKANAGAEEELKGMFQSMKLLSKFYGFYLMCTSSQILVNKNTTGLKKDIMNLPYSQDINEFSLNITENNLINDAVDYYYEFLRHGESASILNPCSENEAIHYSNEYCGALNLLYANESWKFYNQSIKTYNNVIFMTFAHEHNEKKPTFNNYEGNNESISELLINTIHQDLISSRIIRLYSRNKISLIKPNQKRYWLSSIAYRDADKTFSDLIKAGY